MIDRQVVLNQAMNVILRYFSDFTPNFPNFYSREGNLTEAIAIPQNSNTEYELTSKPKTKGLKQNRKTCQFLLRLRSRFPSLNVHLQCNETGQS